MTSNSSSNVTTAPATTKNAAIWFLVGLIVVFAGLELAARRIGPGATARSVIDQHRSNLDDQDPAPGTLLFAGDSSSGAAFDADQLGAAIGRDGYTVWLPDASPTVVTGLVDEFILGRTHDGGEPQREPPGAVVLGVTARMFNATTSPNRQQLLDQMRTSLPWRSRTGTDSWRSDQLIAAEKFAADRLGLVRYRAGLRRPTDWILGLRNEARLELAGDGQTTFFAQESTDDIRDGYEAGEQQALADYLFSDTEASRLLGLIEGLESDGVEVAVVVLPTYQPIYNEFFPQPGDNEQAVDGLLEVLRSNQVDVVDLTDLGNREELFADGNHLNSEGSAEVTAQLANQLQFFDS